MNRSIKKDQKGHELNENFLNNNDTYPLSGDQNDDLRGHKNVGSAMEKTN
jgi:hypothetical protein